MRRTLLRGGIALGLLVVVAILAFSALGARRLQAATPAVAVLHDARGRAIGTIQLQEDAAGRVVLRGVLTGLARGVHGIHFHAVGRCTAPAFTSAGGHLNPDGHPHGLANPAGPHAGDLPNMEVSENGVGLVDTTTDRVSLRSGNRSLFDRDGSAIVVHAAQDDQTTDPAGNSGARIACGAITAGSPR